MPYLSLVSLLLGAFAIGTTEFVVAGLLPAIAADLGVSIADAGLLVTGYALGVAFGGPAMMVGAARFPRKPAILGVLAVFLAAHVGCALAPGFGALLAARAVAAAAHGCFFGLAIVLATQGVPPERRATALAIVVGGINIANIIGVPAGTAVGNAFGWRAAFVMVAAFAALATAAIAAFVPDTRAVRQRMPLGGQVRALANRTVLSAYALIVLQMVAFFGMMTFVAPFLADGAGIGAEGLPLVLLGFGAAGTVGIFAAGPVTDRWPRVTLLVCYPAAAACFALVWAGMPRVPALGVAALAVMWMVGSVAAIAAQNRVLIGAGRAPELASTLMSSVFNVGIAIGAGLGSAALARGLAVSDLPLIGLAAMLAASLLAPLAARDG